MCHYCAFSVKELAACVSQVVVCAGARKELHQWPVFQSVLEFMPDCSIHIHFFSPEMQDDMDGFSRWTSVQQGRCTSWLGADTASAVDEADSSSAAAATYLPVQHLADDQVSAQSESCSAVVSTPYVHSTLEMARAMQQGAGVFPGQAATQDGTFGQAATQDGTRGTTRVPTLQLTFHKGLYHDVIAEPNHGIASADLAFGANAGKHLFS